MRGVKMFQKISVSNKCCFFFTFYSSVNPEKLNVSLFPQKYWAEQLFSTLIIIRNTNNSDKKM